MGNHSKEIERSLSTVSRAAANPSKRIQINDLKIFYKKKIKYFMTKENEVKEERMARHRRAQPRRHLTFEDVSDSLIYRKYNVFYF